MVTHQQQVRFLLRQQKTPYSTVSLSLFFQELYDNYDSFADFVEVEDNARLRQAIDSNDANDLTTSKVKTLLTSEAPMINTIQQAATMMAED